MNGAPFTRPPIFIDRDGTLIEEVHYLSDLAHMRLIAGAADAIARANAAGHPVVVASNQSGVARGIITDAFARESGVHLTAMLAGQGARLDGYYYCPYHPDGQPPFNMEHPDRKPGHGMLLRAARDLALHLKGGCMVGDKLADVDTGAELGVLPILVRTGYGRESEAELQGQPERLKRFQGRGGMVFDALPQALDWFVAHCQ